MKYLKQLLLTLLTLIMLTAPLNALASAPVNINTASIEQLQSVTGVGLKTAEKIIAYRQAHGNFSTVEDLCLIKGIGKT